MNILELRDRYRPLFYSQAWFMGEAFTRILPVDVPLRPPSHLIHRGEAPATARGLRHAVDLANCYVTCPSDPVWNGWLWTSDVDQHGQRIYVGCGEKGLFEFHRHLHLTERFGVPAWR